MIEIDKDCKEGCCPYCGAVAELDEFEHSIDGTRLFRDGYCPVCDRQFTVWYGVTYIGTQKDEDYDA